jgi:hypothetical protein
MIAVTGQMSIVVPLRFGVVEGGEEMLVNASLALLVIWPPVPAAIRPVSAGVIIIAVQIVLDRFPIPRNTGLCGL